MKVSFDRIKAIKLAVIGIVGIFSAAVFFFVPTESSRVAATSSGPSTSFTGAPDENNCTVCHSSFELNSGKGNFTFTGVPANYRPGQVYPITVTINHPGAVVFGFQMVEIDNIGKTTGVWNLPATTPAPLQIRNGIRNGNLRSYIEHTIDGITPTTFDTKSWTFSWTAPAKRAGRLRFYAAGNAGNDGDGPSGDYIYTTSGVTLSGSAISNFDSDTRSDLAVFRPSTGTWFRQSSQNGFGSFQFGQAGDKVVPGDFDGDGKTDHAIWRPATGDWHILKSSGGYTVTNFGVTGDMPVAADYDGDLKTDIAVWRPSNGNWYFLMSETGAFVIRNFGVLGDRPAPADFDADGKADIAVFRSSNASWYMLRSFDNTFAVAQFGAAGDIPLPGDYDGDGSADLSVFRPGNATWYRLNSAGFSQTAFGVGTDEPVPADYDGDGKTDIAVYRAGTWYILGSGGTYNVVGFGEPGDIPVPKRYYYFD